MRVVMADTIPESAVKCTPYRRQRTPGQAEGFPLLLLRRIRKKRFDRRFQAACLRSGRQRLLRLRIQMLQQLLIIVMSLRVGQQFGKDLLGNQMPFSDLVLRSLLSEQAIKHFRSLKEHSLDLGNESKHLELRCER